MLSGCQSVWILRISVCRCVTPSGIISTTHDCNIICYHLQENPNVMYLYLFFLKYIQVRLKCSFCTLWVRSFFSFSLLHSICSSTYFIWFNMFQIQMQYASVNKHLGLHIKQNSQTEHHFGEQHYDMDSTKQISNAWTVANTKHWHALAFALNFIWKLQRRHIEVIQLWHDLYCRTRQFSFGVPLERAL